MLEDRYTRRCARPCTPTPTRSLLERYVSFNVQKHMRALHTCTDIEINQSVISGDKEAYVPKKSHNYI